MRWVAGINNEPDGISVRIMAGPTHKVRQMKAALETSGSDDTWVFSRAVSVEEVQYAVLHPELPLSGRVEEQEALAVCGDCYDAIHTAWDDQLIMLHQRCLMAFISERTGRELPEVSQRKVASIDPFSIPEKP